MTRFAAQFLREPDLFPARLAGEAWGEESLDVALPGGPYRIRGLASAQRASLADRYGDVATGTTFDVDVFRAPREDFRDVDTRGWNYLLDFDTTPSAIAIAGLRLMARIDLDANRAAIWTPVDDAIETWGVIENVLRPLVAVRLLLTGGLLVHSAAVGGTLFAGASGAGKSTIARLAIDAKQPVLSDDLNAIDANRMLVPLPFTGDLERHELSEIAVPLTRIAKLEKGERDGLRAMSVAETVSLLVASAPYVNRDPHRMPLLVERAAELAASTRRSILTFRRDGDPWPILAGP
ncbi:MAG TPA: hypothetical protein VF698_19835 [Thermoanaerobaculia bacterium]